MKLFIPRAKLHVRKYFFSHRVVPHWNSLPHCQRTLSEQFQVAIGHILARYGRQKPMSFLVHQLLSSNSSSSLLKFERLPEVRKFAALEGGNWQVPVTW